MMGAMTYVGNAPNFAVKAIAEHSGLKMPSFFGYMGYSLAVLDAYLPGGDRDLLPLTTSAATVSSSAPTISSIPRPSMPPGRSPSWIQDAVMPMTGVSSIPSPAVPAGSALRM